MNRVYLLLFFAIISIKGFAQRNADLQLLPSYIGATIDTKHLLVQGENVLLSGNGNSQYWFTWRIKNLGPDMLTQGDTLAIKTGFDTIVYYVFPAGKTLKKDSVISIVPTSDITGLQIPIVLKPAPSVSQSSTDTAYLWCDSIYAAASASGTPLSDPAQDNNMICDTARVTYWLAGVDKMMETNEGFVIYPNPSSGVLNFECHFADPALNFSITLKDVMGKVVHRNVWEHEIPRTVRYRIDTGNLPRGLYTAELVFDGGKITRTIAVQ